MDRGCTYLRHMQEATHQALAYIEGMDRESFLADKRTQQAVILNLLVLGEAVTKLLSESPALTERHAHIPWQGMRGMRNRIAHGYFEIDLSVVWTTVERELPVLEQQLAVLVSEVCAEPNREP